MTDTTSSESFRLSTGGLFHSVVTRLQIQKPDSYSIKRRILVLIALCWLPLLLLTAYEGTLINQHLEIPFIYDLSPHVRFLIVIPLLIAADPLIDPLIASNLQSIGSSGLIGDEHKKVYTKAVEQFRHRKDSYLADIVILVIVSILVVSYIVNFEDIDANIKYNDWSIARGDNEPHPSYAGWWFLLVSSPILQIILFRWFWRFYLWAQFLFQVSRIQLKLQPTHPDMVGGLGILKNGENSFILIFFAFGAMLSVSIAEEILYADMTMTQAQGIIAMYIGVAILIMTLPLLFFSGQLIRAKRIGRVVYGSLGYRLSDAFDKKWGTPGDKTSGEELLETADASAVCDYSDVYEVVREMRFLPTTMKDFVAQALILAVPFIPLVFIEIPVTEVLKRILDTVI